MKWQTISCNHCGVIINRQSLYIHLRNCPGKRNIGQRIAQFIGEFLGESTITNPNRSGRSVGGGRRTPYQYAEQPNISNNDLISHEYDETDNVSTDFAYMEGVSGDPQTELPSDPFLEPPPNRQGKDHIKIQESQY